jgi:hypothetical protein
MKRKYFHKSKAFLCPITSDIYQVKLSVKNDAINQIPVKKPI